VRCWLRSGLRVAVAESGRRHLRHPDPEGDGGSPAFFALGVTVCDPASAAKFLPASRWSGTDLVNAAAASGLAEGVRRLSGADVGVGVTGRVGQDKSQDHVVYIAWPLPMGRTNWNKSGLLPAVHRKPDDQDGPGPDSKIPAQ